MRDEPARILNCVCERRAFLKPEGNPTAGESGINERR
jgi:hypothetical protein